MIDLRPVIFAISLLSTAFGVYMLIPAFVDLYLGDGSAGTFFLSALITIVIGGASALATADASLIGLSIRQTFLLTTVSWLVLSMFGAIPFVIGTTHLSLADAFFESVSGLTTTGSTVLTRIENLPRGMLLWRGLMQWFGGIGIIVVAIGFLPTLRVGGMQAFRSEGFETMGKILPRAVEIASSISIVYVAITALCAIAFAMSGMNLFDSVVTAMTTLSTGGFANSDASFGAYQGAPEYISAVFMIIASLPFVRYVQMINGSTKPLFKDSQVQTFLAVEVLLVVVIALYRMYDTSEDLEPAFRESFFNVSSILSGTGFVSADYGLWGAFPVVLFFLMGLVGGCAGSTCCSVKIFRYQLLAAAIKSQIQKIHSPNGIFITRYQGRQVEDDLLGSVMAFFVAFMLTLASLAVALSLLGLDPVTAVSGAATAIANIGPGLGPEIGPSGNFAGLPSSAKWVLSFGMLVGRLELLSVYVLFTVGFWRD